MSHSEVGPDTFEGRWNTRIGPAATKALKRSRRYTLVAFPSIWVFGAAAGLLFTTSVRWLAIALVVLDCILILEWIWLKRLLAKLISAHVTVSVAWYQLPRFKLDSFDRWLAWKRSGGRTKRRWGLGPPY